MIAIGAFAGVGWSVAAQSLGIDEFGIDNMPEVQQSRTLNGFNNMPGTGDIWQWLPKAWRHLGPAGTSELFIASPPCQTFSMTGSGKGREVMDQIHQLIENGTYMSLDALRQFGEEHDPRTALVLTPLHAIIMGRPRYVTLEQVPTVLPIWESYATVMRSMGYAVATGELRSEQFGVPQTRRRAFLVAELGAESVSLPEPTHSSYHTRKPLELDAGLKPWVSMADAGIFPDSVELLSTSSSHGNYERRGVRYGDQPAATVTSHIDRTLIRFVSNKRYENSASRTLDLPAPTITAGHDTRADRVWMWDGKEERVTVAQAAALQSFPPGFQFAGSRTKQLVQVGNAVPPLLAKAVLKKLIFGGK